MPLEIRRTGGALVIGPGATRLAGVAADAIADDLLALVDAGHERLVLDLSRVSEIDSSGLAALVLVLKRVSPDGALVLLRVREVPWSVFRLTRLDRVFRAYASEEDALRAVEPALPAL